MSIDRFRIARNTALAGFLHGAHLTRLARALYPLCDASGARAGDALDATWSAARAAGIDLPAPPPRPAPRDEARFLAQAHEAEAPEQARDGDAFTLDVPGWEPARHGRVPRLVRARRELQDVGRIFLHGSCADLRLTAYSDLDTLLLLPREVVTSPRALLAARRRVIRSLRALRRFDPLQHHGHFVLAEPDLAGYPDAVFPAVVWRTCVALDEAGARLVAATRRDREESGRRFRLLARRVLDSDLARGRTNAYRLKADLSVFMLLPALWLQARGRAVSKAASFELAYAELSSEAVATYRRAARIREIWTYREPRLNAWLRRLWFNGLLPAALDSARAAPPAPAVAELADDAFLAGIEAAVREMLEKESGEGEVHRADRRGTSDALA